MILTSKQPAGLLNKLGKQDSARPQQPVQISNKICNLGEDQRNRQHLLNRKCIALLHQFMVSKTIKTIIKIYTEKQRTKITKLNDTNTLPHKINYHSDTPRNLQYSPSQFLRFTRFRANLSLVSVSYQNHSGSQSLHKPIQLTSLHDLSDIGS